MRGHTDIVNSVKFFPTGQGHPQIILSGSVDKTIRIWRVGSSPGVSSELILCLEGHTSSINCLAVFKGSNIVASGSADATVKIWRLTLGENTPRAELLQTIQTSPRFFPLALALHFLGTSKDLILAVAGTKSIVQIYAASEDRNFHYQATLSGHEGWIRSLTITRETLQPDSDLILASGSQDKYIRLWRINKNKTALGPEHPDVLAALKQSLSNKAYKINVSETSYSLTFEALLLGHEDWIYTVSWRLGNESLQLLSASADNSLAIWECEARSGVWVPTTRLGEISAQKGSTTATGSTGGFWIGLWSQTGESLVCLGRTGSWRMWDYAQDQQRWLQGVGTSGHTKPVTDVSWSKNGGYLISTSSDQTTRLHAEWRREAKRSWHEMARPQIHGYDINCIDSIGQTQFISGADEKLLRVFDEPRATARMLAQLCDIQTQAGQKLPDTANIPMLGLSNKATENAVGEQPESNRERGENGEISAVLTVDYSVASITQPPFEDQLARHTLWPECEKLYGHGYEISAVAASHDGTVVATSCRASSLDHAVIRLYTTKDWREVKPSLVAHSLTVTSLCFSEDDQFLLSVGRDRQWAVFERDVANLESYILKHSNPKGHSRMILNTCWAPVEVGRVFATAGRDKSVKVWKLNNETSECLTTIAATSAVTAVNIAPRLVQGGLMVAMGTETGEVILHVLDLGNGSIKLTQELCS